LRDERSGRGHPGAGGEAFAFAPRNNTHAMNPIKPTPANSTAHSHSERWVEGRVTTAGLG